jgi:RNase P/RNase MRP subunit p30
MFNIVSFSPEAANAHSYGYEKLYEAAKVKAAITRVKTTADSAEHKGRKTLILIENHEFDDGSIKLVGEKKKACFLIDLSKIIDSNGVPRAIALSKLRTFLKLCNTHGAFYTFADFARDENELRSARELMHISLLLGINRGQAKFAMKMLKHYLE